MNYFSDFGSVYYTFDRDAKNLKLVTNIFTKIQVIPEILKNTSIYFKYSVKDQEKPEDLAFNVYGDANRYWIITFANQILNPKFDWPLDSYSFERHVDSKYKTMDFSLVSSNGTFEVGESVFNTDNQYVGQVEAVGSGNVTLSLIENAFTVGTVISGDTSFAYGNIASYAQNTSGLVWSQANMRNPVYTQKIINTMGDEQITTIEVTQNDYNFANNNVYPRLMLDTIKSVTIGTSTVAIEETYAEQNYYDYELDMNEKRRTIMVPDPIYVSQIEDEMKRLLRNV